MRQEAVAILNIKIVGEEAGVYYLPSLFDMPRGSDQKNLDSLPVKKRRIPNPPQKSSKKAL
jgi:hypothetical protein